MKRRVDARIKYRKSKNKSQSLPELHKKVWNDRFHILPPKKTGTYSVIEDPHASGYRSSSLFQISPETPDNCKCDDSVFNSYLPGLPMVRCDINKNVRKVRKIVNASKKSPSLDVLKLQKEITSLQNESLLQRKLFRLQYERDQKLVTLRKYIQNSLRESRKCHNVAPSKPLNPNQESRYKNISRPPKFRSIHRNSIYQRGPPTLPPMKKKVNVKRSRSKVSKHSKKKKKKSRKFQNLTIKEETKQFARILSNLQSINSASEELRKLFLYHSNPRILQNSALYSGSKLRSPLPPFHILQTHFTTPPKTKKSKTRRKKRNYASASFQKLRNCLERSDILYISKELSLSKTMTSKLIYFHLRMTYPSTLRSQSMHSVEKETPKKTYLSFHEFSTIRHNSQFIDLLQKLRRNEKFFGFLWGLAKEQSKSQSRNRIKMKSRIKSKKVSKFERVRKDSRKYEFAKNDEQEYEEKIDNVDNVDKLDDLDTPKKLKIIKFMRIEEVEEESEFKVLVVNDLKNKKKTSEGGKSVRTKKSVVMTKHTDSQFETPSRLEDEEKKEKADEYVPTEDNFSLQDSVTEPTKKEKHEDDTTSPFRILHKQRIQKPKKIKNEQDSRNEKNQKKKNIDIDSTTTTATPSIFTCLSSIRFCQSLVRCYLARTEFCEMIGVLTTSQNYLLRHVIPRLEFHRVIKYEHCINTKKEEKEEKEVERDRFMTSRPPPISVSSPMDVDVEIEEEEEKKDEKKDDVKSKGRKRRRKQKNKLRRSKSMMLNKKDKRIRRKMSFRNVKKRNMDMNRLSPNIRRNSRSNPSSPKNMKNMKYMKKRKTSFRMKKQRSSRRHINPLIRDEKKEKEKEEKMKVMEKMKIPKQKQMKDKNTTKLSRKKEKSFEIESFSSFLKSKSKSKSKEEKKSDSIRRIQSFYISKKKRNINTNVNLMKSTPERSGMKEEYLKNRRRSVNVNLDVSPKSRYVTPRIQPPINKKRDSLMVPSPASPSVSMISSHHQYFKHNEIQLFKIQRSRRSNHVSPKSPSNISNISNEEKKEKKEEIEKEIEKETEGENTGTNSKRADWFGVSQELLEEESEEEQDLGTPVHFMSPTGDVKDEIFNVMNQSLRDIGNSVSNSRDITPVTPISPIPHEKIEIPKDGNYNSLTVEDILCHEDGEIVVDTRSPKMRRARSLLSAADSLENEFLSLLDDL